MSYQEEILAEVRRKERKKVWVPYTTGAAKQGTEPGKERREIVLQGKRIKTNASSAIKNAGTGNDLHQGATGGTSVKRSTNPGEQKKKKKKNKRD